MRAKRAKPGVPPRLEALEPRLAPVATLTPFPDNADLFTLQIDLSRHPSGGDGLPDTVYVSRAAGDVEVVLVGREPELLYRGGADGLAGIQLLGSADVEYVLVGEDARPLLAFAAGGDDVLVHLGQRVPVPPPVESPEPAPDPSVPPSASFVEARVPALPFYPGLVFLSVSAATPVGPGAGQMPPDEEERPLVPPELLGGAPVEEPLDVRRLVGGSRGDAGPAAVDGPEAAAPEEEPAGDEGPPDEA